MNSGSDTSGEREGDGEYGPEFLTWMDETHDWKGLTVRPAESRSWETLDDEDRTIGVMEVSRVEDGDVDAFIEEYGEYDIPVPERFEFGYGEFPEWEKGVDPNGMYWPETDPTVEAEIQYGTSIARLEAAVRALADTPEYDPDDFRIVMGGEAGCLVRGPESAIVVAPSFTGS